MGLRKRWHIRMEGSIETVGSVINHPLWQVTELRFQIERDGLRTIVNAQFLKQVFDVKLDRIRRNILCCGYLFVGLPGGEGGQYFEFTPG